MHVTNDAVVVSRNGLFLGNRTDQSKAGLSVGLLTPDVHGAHGGYERR